MSPDRKLKRNGRKMGKTIRQAGRCMDSCHSKQTFHIFHFELIKMSNKVKIQI